MLGIPRVASLPDTSIGLQLVRFFDPSGQNDILGWHLDHATLEFLVSISADIDSDEYDSC